MIPRDSKKLQQKTNREWTRSRERATKGKHKQTTWKRRRSTYVGNLLLTLTHSHCLCFGYIIYRFIPLPHSVTLTLQLHFIFPFQTVCPLFIITILLLHLLSINLHFIFTLNQHTAFLPFKHLFLSGSKFTLNKKSFKEKVNEFLPTMARECPSKWDRVKECVRYRYGFKVCQYYTNTESTAQGCVSFSCRHINFESHFCWWIQDYIPLTLAHNANIKTSSNIQVVFLIHSEINIKQAITHPPTASIQFKLAHARTYEHTCALLSLLCPAFATFYHFLRTLNNAYANSCKLHTVLHTHTSAGINSPSPSPPSPVTVHHHPLLPRQTSFHSSMFGISHTPNNAKNKQTH